MWGRNISYPPLHAPPAALPDPESITGNDAMPRTKQGRDVGLWIRGGHVGGVEHSVRQCAAEHLAPRLRSQTATTGRFFRLSDWTTKGYS